MDSISIYSSHKVNAWLQVTFEYSAQIVWTTDKVILWCIFDICTVIVEKNMKILPNLTFVDYGKKKVI